MQKFLHYLHEKFIGVKAPKGFIETFFLLIIILATGTFFYSQHEGWSIIDSLYFSVITITTVGYGDFHPTTDASKIFTIFYIFVGVGLGLYVISTLSSSIMKGRARRISRVEKILKRLKKN